MLKLCFKIFVFSIIFDVGLTDVYLHNPRGSNNRLNEKSANRANANRMFDSQNNNKGGYNKGDATDGEANTYEKQYEMKYFQSATSTAGDSGLVIEWTNQHGAGQYNHKLNSNFIIQYLCQPDTYRIVTQQTDEKEFFNWRVNMIRDGLKTNTQHDPKHLGNKNFDDYERDVRYALNKEYGLHESAFNYASCYERPRNKGLFTADQDVKDNRGATATRQNPNGNRYGTECPEERDYYPYWHPTEWKDIAIITSHPEQCATLKAESYNVKPRHFCVGPKVASEYNNQEACENANHQWLEYHNYLEIVDIDREVECVGEGLVWGLPFNYTKTDDLECQKRCLRLLPEPDCVKAEFTRVNHLGNADSGDTTEEDMDDLLMYRYKWRIPSFSHDQRCVLRIRYNISTDDYNPWETDSQYNEDNVADEDDQLIQNNPEVDIGVDLYEDPALFRLAINTAQFGRTFQDRSHVFILKKRPDNFGERTLHNMNVRGKRGNIVQTFPAVEYDFTPTHLKMRKNDLVHVQWTGSNSHDNGNPAGDGQAGDDGEGEGGTDRNNFCPLSHPGVNYPMPWEVEENNIWRKSNVLWSSCDQYKNEHDAFSKEDIGIQLASSGYFCCRDQNLCGDESVDKKNALQKQLNNAPASFGGVVMEVEPGTYHVMCTRNNNFSNRSQKGKITVENN